MMWKTSKTPAGVSASTQVTLRLVSIALLLVLLLSLIPAQGVKASPTLSIDPQSLTWNIIGLDSSNVSVGPNRFPVGARVCNTSGGPTTVTVNFNWDDGTNASFIYLRPGTASTVTLSFTGNGCKDAYFEVEVARNTASYNKTRRYHITATDASGTVSSPRPRELFVEYLISQSRNSVLDMQYGTSPSSLVSVPNGGTLTLMKGQTYYIKLVGTTATQGYEQIESFINFPNTIFQVLSVTTTYSAESSPTLNPPYDKLYGDACVWENDPNSPNYRSCLGTGKAGGNITVLYEVKILEVPSAPLVNPEPLSTLIYDFSGSSFHYNADFGVSTRFAQIVNASIAKSFSPKTIAPGGTSTLTFTISNPGGSAISNVNFTDNLPSGMVVASTPNLTYIACGSPLPVSVSPGAASLSFSNITVAGLGTCTISVNVTASSNALYTNTSDPLYIGSDNTGSTATDILVVSSSPPPPTTCATRTIVATWNFENYAGLADATLDNGPFNASSYVVSTAPLGVYRPAGSSESAIVDRDLTIPASWTVPSTGNSTTVWGIRRSWLSTAPTNPGDPSTFTSPFFEFQVNTEGLYGGLGIALDYNLVTAAGWTNGGTWYVLYSTDNGTSWSLLNSGAWSTKASWITTGVTATSTSSTPTVRFRVYFIGAASGGNNANANLYIDNVSITGCPAPARPTIAKAFTTDPVTVGGTSVLTFTIANTGTPSTNLTGLSFSDVLPSGVTIASPASVTNTCGGTVTAVPNTQTISLSGGALNAGQTCTISVTTLGVSAGSFINTSTNISSTETGPNNSTTPNVGFAQDGIQVIAPPAIAKAFADNIILTGESTTLSFTITNPNPSTALTGVNFTDSLPSGLVVAATPGLTNTCGGTATATAGSPTVSLSGVTLAAGASCTVTVNVTGNTAGLKNNTVTVSSTNGGTGNTATADVLVKDPTPAIALLKQVGPAASGPWSAFLAVTPGAPVYYRFTVENTGDVPLSSVNVSDPATYLNLAACTWQDGDGNPLTAPFTLPVADSDEGHIATCVLGPVTAVTGAHPNTATASGTYSSTTVTDQSTATYATVALSLVKSVSPGTFTQAGDVLTYSYLVTNTGAAPIPGPVTVADDKTTVTCPAVDTVGDNDNFFDPGESITCTATYTVTAADVTAQSVTNTATATVNGYNSNADSETAYLAALTIDKDTTTATVTENGTVIYTIVVVNTGAAPLTNVQVTDSLPDFNGAAPGKGYTVSSVTATGGFITNPAFNGDTNINLLNGTGTLGVGQSFTITITLALNSAVPGVYDNTAAVITSQTGAVDDDGAVAQDSGTPPGQDPADDEDVTVLAATATPTATNTPTPTPTPTNTATATPTPTDTPT
ncbi:MAG: hypothetical protein WHV44_07585, partial [Anaerolineales bacterium]